MSSELSTSILIIKKSDSALPNLQKYLQKKDYIVETVTQLKPAILKALEIRAQFVFVPFDHPNPKVKQLPRVFLQVLNAHVIPYLESQSATEILDIRRQGFKYYLLPPILGPKVERMMTRILMDIKAEAKAQLKNRPFKNRSEEDVINFQGPNLNITEDQLLEEASLQYQNGVDPDAHRFQSPQDAARFIKYLEGVSPGRRPLRWQQQEGESSEAYSARLVKGFQVSTDDRVSFYDAVEIQAMEIRMARTDFHFDGADLKLTDDEIQRALLLLVQQGSLPVSLKCRKDEDSRDYFYRLWGILQEQKLEKEYLAAFSKNVPAQEVEQDQEKEQEKLLDETPEARKIARMAIKAFKELSNKSKIKETYYRLEKTSKILCLQIENNLHKGYLVVASAQEIILDEEFRKVVFQVIQQHFKKANFEITEEDLFQIEMKTVPYQEWVTDQADFLYQSVYNGQEIGISYFPVHKFTPELDEGPNKDLKKVSVHEIRGDHPVQFDLFLYLPLNEHLILYAAKERIIFQKQIDHLIERGVDFLYVRSEATKQLRYYQTQNFIDSKIENYLEKIKAGMNL